MTLNHPIFTRWPAQYPDRLQLFSFPTPNGVKVGIMLGEPGSLYRGDEDERAPLHKREGLVDAVIGFVKHWDRSHEHPPY